MDAGPVVQDWYAEGADKDMHCKLPLQGGLGPPADSHSI